MQQQVLRHEGETLACSLGVSYWETSALSGLCLQEAFNALLLKVMCYVEGVETQVLTPACISRRHPSGVSAALKEGALDTVQGLSLADWRQGGGPPDNIFKRQMQFRRYSIDDSIDSLCEV